MRNCDLDLCHVHLCSGSSCCSKIWWVAERLFSVGNVLERELQSPRTACVSQRGAGAVCWSAPLINWLCFYKWISIQCTVPGKGVFLLIITKIHVWTCNSFVFIMSSKSNICHNCYKLSVVFVAHSWKHESNIYRRFREWNETKCIFFPIQVLPLWVSEKIEIQPDQWVVWDAHIA